MSASKYLSNNCASKSKNRTLGKWAPTTKIRPGLVRKIAVKEAEVSKRWNKTPTVPKGTRRSFESWEEEMELLKLPGFLATVQQLDTPEKIQAWLDNIPYYHGRVDHTVQMAWRLGRFDCFSGSLFAAYCFQFHGYGPPQVLGLDADPRIDDGHMLSVYRVGKLWGAISKSQYSGLRGRDPVYATPRELAMSYFEFHVNKKGVKSLRSYSSPVNLDKIDPDRQWLLGRIRAKLVSRATNNCPHRCLPHYFRTEKLKPLRGPTLWSQTEH